MAERSLRVAAGRDLAKHSGDGVAVSGLAGRLGLAAAPTFALMALWTGPFGSETVMPCMGAQGTWSPNSMALMYALMSAFHLGPWLNAIRGRPGRR